MSIYVISDLHGCKKEFDQMLELIGFNDYDELWIDGDICDRGKESIPLLQEIMSYDNMHLIFGNHDVWLARYIQDLIDAKKDNNSVDMTEDLMLWLHYNGGYGTMDQFMDLDFPECYDIKLYLEDKLVYKRLKVNGRKFLLVHAGLPDDFVSGRDRLSEVPEKIMIWGHIGLDDNPLTDTTLIVGHTPTFAYGDEFDGKIAHGKEGTILHIDCGCVYGRTLGCIRLDDMQEFYVPSTYPRR
ncbi:MAG: fructose-bisphosphatase class III [Solobacterium sp.]|nr:fructose-bisphosphatase class III [Solobacterium sp.]